MEESYGRFGIWELFVFFDFLLLFSSFFPAVTAVDISLGSSLSASNPNQTWSSPSNLFSLGFLPINSSAYSLAITYGSIPIWKAGGDDVIVGPGASFHLLSDGDLRLLDSSGLLVWSSNTSGHGVSHANLDDSGNFILQNRKSGIVWSTFDHPTDTIVSSQNFTLGEVLKSGIYSFSLNKSGNLTLMWNNNVVYFSSGLNSSVNVNLSNPQISLSVGILSLYDSKLSAPQTLAYSNDYGESSNIFRFLRLDSDGNLRIYSSQDRGIGSPAVSWSAVSDQCLVFGYCGNMGICSYNDTSPICGCPSKNFVPIDPNDTRKGCKLENDIKDCPGSLGMIELDHTRFLTNPPKTNPQVLFQNLDACRGNCLSPGPCLASTSFGDGSGQCFQVSSFASGYRSASIPSTSFVKVCMPVEPNPPSSVETSQDHEKLKAWIIAIVVLSTLVAIILLEGGFWWFCCQKSPEGLTGQQYTLLEYASGAPVQFTYKQLQQATRGFKEKLGEGGFGAVYKAVLANKTVAAVKQLEGIEQGERQFRMEVATISSTHHLNLVRLIGFCSEGRRRLLVYEFMKNGSLDNFLFTPEKESGKLLSWRQRFNIALGTAKGITYLHEECRDCIVHCDIKPENILLDDNFNARVSDFGLAKLINPKDHRYRTLTSVRGTRGYLPPEWLANLPITTKSDVYSYGMVLLEIISGRRNFEVSQETNMKKFSVWAYEEFNKGNVEPIIDKRLMNELDIDMDQAMRAIQVSFWCIQEQPSQRPMMSSVVQMLEGILEIEKPPDPKVTPLNSLTGSSTSTSIVSPSTFATSGPSHNSSSSFQITRGSPPLSRIDVERPTSSLILQQEAKFLS